MPQIKLKSLRRSLERADIKLDREKRVVEFSFSSENPVERWFGKEVLSHEKDAAEFERLNDGANILFNHDWDKPIGVIEKAWMGEDKRGYVRARFAKSAHADEVFGMIEDGVLRNVSFGYQVKEMKREKSTEEGDEYLATKWMPFEVSIVTVPADHTVGIGRDFNQEQEVKIEGDLGKRALEEIAKLTPIAIEKEMPVSITEIKTLEAPTSKGNSMDPIELKKLQDEARQQERERQTQIRSMCEKHQMDSDFTSSLVDGGKSLEEAREAVLSKISTRQAPVSGSADAPQLGLSPKEIKSFHFMNALRALSNPGDRRAQEAASFEREVSDAASKVRGKTSQGFYIPQEVLSFGQSQRDLNKGTAADGGYTVATSLVGFIEMLRKKSVLQRAGATVLNGLVGDIAIPKQTGGATAYWVAESGAPTETKQAFAQVTMTPKTLGAFTDISRKLLIQSSLDVENLVRNDLATVVALAIDLAGLYGSGAANQPLGLKDTTDLNTTDFAAATPTFAEIITMETEVATDNADIGSMKYLVTAAGRGDLKSAEKFSSTGQTIWEAGGTVNGYQTEVSNQITTGDYWFGVWSQLMIGMWSGLDLMVDPYAGATAGTVRVIALQDVDVAVRHAKAFTRGADTI